MASQSVHPLRIQKGVSASPTKSSIPRPLSELAPTERRRNSPSFSQSNKAMLNTDSSPFQSSPFNASDANSSPRLFWQGRDPATPNNRFNIENGSFSARKSSPSPTRRSSLEKLQRASRVKNSNMFAREQKQEYDPTSVPVIERPLAKPIQGNAYGGTGLDGLRSEEHRRPFSHVRSESKSSIPLLTNVGPLSPNSNMSAHQQLRSPTKDQASPGKSSLSTRHNAKSKFDPENGTWSEANSEDEKVLPDGKSLHRHAKSVTFDAAPPQVNEYEMATPDLSSIGTASRENSYDSAEDDEDIYKHGELEDNDDSFDASLEDTDKTPVVGPEDWRHASPEMDSLSVPESLEDPFASRDGSPMGLATSSTRTVRPNAARTDSLNSNGDHRPLPPLPGLSTLQSTNGLSAAAERASSVQRNLPSPPAAASFSKSEIQGLAGGRMPLEERLRLMMIQDEEKPKTAAEMQRERRLRRGAGRDMDNNTPERETGVNSEEGDTLGDLGDYQLPQRISRESILRKVNGQKPIDQQSDYHFSSPLPSSSPQRGTLPDPDVPIPSTEDQSALENAGESVTIKPEQEDEMDVYSIPEMYGERAESRLGNHDASEDVYNEYLISEDDAESQYSEPTPLNQSPDLNSNSIPEENGPPTPRPTSPIHEAISLDPAKDDKNNGLPDLGGFLNNNEFALGLQSYMSPSQSVEDHFGASGTPQFTQSLGALDRPSTPPQISSHSKSLTKPEYDGAGWGSDEDDPGTPDSVIRHHVPHGDSPPADSPAVPEQVATIKASSSGSKLKTRPSATPSDIVAMREARRQISAEIANIPPIPERHRNRPSISQERTSSEEDDAGTEENIERKPSFKKRSLTLDIGGDLGLSLDEDFDRVIEAQKVAFDLLMSHPESRNGGLVSSDVNDNNFRMYNANVTPRKQRGYLMRQNTKLVVAISDVDRPANEARDTKSAGNSPVKKQRPESWTVEPWNGQIRKKSIRENGSPRKRIPQGPVPPMPGHQSNVSGLGILTEDDTPQEPIEPDSSERGRLFVKVIGVKDLDLPLPKNERTWFSLTLDNGVHCVTTAWLELGRNAPIGQEFELVVPNELEFQLTLNARLDKPEPKRVVESPTKSFKTAKPSTFSRVFASPKKRKELEMRQKEEEQRLTQQHQRDAQAKRMSAQPTAWDLLSPLTADDGSFGRSYICLKDHESRCYGRPYIVDVACFNEWATEDATASSSLKAKRGNTHVQRRAPYKVGKLELQLLFVPKPKGAKDDDMPKSMNSCIREMKEAEQALSRTWEGYLSQQGGDCPYWRRRLFKLCGNKLTAYHEMTGQPRATINLSNAVKLIDDRRALTQKETTGKGGSRRKSGFAEEEEGYMFVEEGFRIRFANGEVIDFYADAAKDKEGWMRVLDQCIGTHGDGKGGARWCDMVLRREASVRRRESRKVSGGRDPRYHTRTKSMII